MNEFVFVTVAAGWDEINGGEAKNRKAGNGKIVTQLTDCSLST